MTRRTAFVPVAFVLAASLMGLASPLQADTVQLANGDVLRGKVVSLNGTQLVFRSESFGEIKIERSKVELIGLGTKALPSTRQAAAAAPGAAGSLLSGVAPLLGTPSAQKSLGPMVDQLLGAGGIGDMQKNVDTARKGLLDLKKDLGSGPESQALDAYINLLNQFAPLSAAAGQQSRPSPPHPTPAHPTPPRAKPPAADKGPSSGQTSPAR